MSIRNLLSMTLLCMLGTSCSWVEIERSAQPVRLALSSAERAGGNPNNGWLNIVYEHNSAIIRAYSRETLFWWRHQISLPNEKASNAVFSVTDFGTIIIAYLVNQKSPDDFFGDVRLYIRTAAGETKRATLPSFTWMPTIETIGEKLYVLGKSIELWEIDLDSLQDGDVINLNKQPALAQIYSNPLCGQYTEVAPHAAMARVGDAGDQALIVGYFISRVAVPSQCTTISEFAGVRFATVRPDEPYGSNVWTDDSFLMKQHWFPGDPPELQPHWKAQALRSLSLRRGVHGVLFAYSESDSSEGMQRTRVGVYYPSGTPPAINHVIAGELLNEIDIEHHEDTQLPLAAGGYVNAALLYRRDSSPPLYREVRFNATTVDTASEVALRDEQALTGELRRPWQGGCRLGRFLNTWDGARYRLVAQRWCPPAKSQDPAE